MTFLDYIERYSVHEPVVIVPVLVATFIVRIDEFRNQARSIPIRGVTRALYQGRGDRHILHAVFY